MAWWLVAIGVVAVAMAAWLASERGRWPLPSTSDFFRQGGWRRAVDLSVLHGYLYMRFQKLYLRILIRLLAPVSPLWMTNWLVDRYHAKVLTEEQARTLISIDEPIPRQDLEQVVPYPLARELLLNTSPRIVVYPCGCRLARDTHCEPVQVCLFVGDPFASFMLEHHPDEARELDRSEALDLLAEEHARGHVHNAWFKDAMLGRFYAICNCCACCCLGMETMRRQKNLSGAISPLKPSGFVAIVDALRCQGCGACVRLCPFEALMVHDGLAQRDEDACMGCGVCVDACPTGAISLVRDPAKGTPLDVRLLGATSGANLPRSA